MLHTLQCYFMEKDFLNKTIFIPMLHTSKENIKVLCFVSSEYPSVTDLWNERENIADYAYPAPLLPSENQEGYICNPCLDIFCFIDVLISDMNGEKLSVCICAEVEVHQAKYAKTCEALLLVKHLYLAKSYDTSLTFKPVFL